MAQTAQERLQEIRTRAAELAAKGIRSADETKELEALLTESSSVRAQIEQDKQLTELNAYATGSAGLPVLAGAGTGTGHDAPMDASARAAADAILTPAGETVMTHDRERGIRIDEHYGEGVYAESVRKTIRTTGYRAAFREYLRTSIGGQVSANAYRTLQEGADTAGGFLVPEDMLDRVIAREPTPTRVQGRVTQLQTGRDALTAPKVVYSTDDLYTTGIRVSWTGEIPSSSTAHRVTDPVFGQLRVPVYTAMLSIPVTNDMIEDSAFPLVSWLSGKFAETIDLLKDNMILNGTGQGQPEGILANPAADANQPAVINSGSAATIGTDGKFFNNIAFALPEQYDENAAWVFNKTSTGNAIGNLQDQNGRFLWGAGLQDSGLDNDLHGRRLLGYPVIFSGFMPNVGSSTYPILFGDLRGYYLVNRIGMSVQVLRELYAETNQILILGRIRFGGVVAEPWRLKIGRCHS